MQRPRSKWLLIQREVELRKRSSLTAERKFGLTFPAIDRIPYYIFYFGTGHRCLEARGTYG